MALIAFQKNDEKNLKLFILIFQLVLLISYFSLINCENIIDLTDSTILNQVITLNHGLWRAGHGATNKNGDLIMEFSLNPHESESRLFFGLKKNGRFYFEDEPYFKEITSMNCVDCGDKYRYKGRFESMNLFVSLTDDTSKSKQYLFSMSSDDSLVELIDIEDNFSYFAWKGNNFFNLSYPIISYRYSLFEIKDTNTYISVFIASEGIIDNKEYSNSITINKFQLSSFESNIIKMVHTVEISDAYNGKIVTAFRLDLAELIVILYETDINTYKFLYYNDNLQSQGEKHFWDINNNRDGEGIFCKGISLKNNHFILAFFNDGNNGGSLHIHLKVYVNTIDYDTLIRYYDFSSFSFKTDVSSSELYKLTDDRVVLFTT